MNLPRSCLFLLFSLCVLVLPTGSRAQEAEAVASFARPGHAFVFHFFGGSALFYKGYVSERSSVRLGIDAEASYGDRSGEEHSRYIRWGPATEDTTLYDYDSGSHSTNENYSFSAVYFYDVASTRLLTVSLGLGPLVGFGHGKSWGQTTFYQDTTDLYWEDKSSLESMGALAVVGVETFVTRNLSVLGQYEVQAAYTWRKSTNTSLHAGPSYVSASESKQSSSGWDGRVNSVKIGVSVYF